MYIVNVSELLVILLETSRVSGVKRETETMRE